MDLRDFSEVEWEVLVNGCVHEGEGEIEPGYWVCCMRSRVDGDSIAGELATEGRGGCNAHHGD